MKAATGCITPGHVPQALAYLCTSISVVLIFCMSAGRRACVRVCIRGMRWAGNVDFTVVQGCVYTMKVNSGASLLNHAPFWPLKCTSLFPHNGSIAFPAPAGASSLASRRFTDALPHTSVNGGDEGKNRGWVCHVMAEHWWGTVIMQSLLFSLCTGGIVSSGAAIH